MIDSADIASVQQIMLILFAITTAIVLAMLAYEWRVKPRYT